MTHAYEELQLQSDQLTASQHTRALHIKHVEELVTARCMILIKKIRKANIVAMIMGNKNKTLYHFQSLYGLNFEGR